MGIQSTKRIVVSLALAAVALVALILMLSAQFVRAQPSGEIYVDKQLGRANPVVHVGEYLTFTVLIRNDTVFTVTTLPLSDTYNTAVLGFVDAVPPPDTVDEEAGRIDWGDLTTSFGDLAPGQAIVLVVGFVAEHPQTAVVNAAEVHDVLGGAGALSGTQSIISDLESVGGSSLVDAGPGGLTIDPDGYLPSYATATDLDYEEEKEGESNSVSNGDQWWAPYSHQSSLQIAQLTCSR